jgi:hypothetical protein
MSDAILHDRGSALMLMPAAVLIVLVLAAITVDLSLVHLGRREASAAAEAAANDAVTFGLDEAAYRRGEGYHLDPGRVRTAVKRSLSVQSTSRRWVGSPHVTIEGTRVTVTVTIRIDYLFARAIPGGPDRTTVTAVGSARPVTR